MKKYYILFGVVCLLAVCVYLVTSVKSVQNLVSGRLDDRTVISYVEYFCRAQYGIDNPLFSYIPESLNVEGEVEYDETEQAYRLQGTHSFKLSVLPYYRVPFEAIVTILENDQVRVDFTRDCNYLGQLDVLGISHSVETFTGQFDKDNPNIKE